MPTHPHIRRRLLALGAAALTSLAVAPAAHANVVSANVQGAGTITEDATLATCTAPAWTPDTSVGMTCPFLALPGWDDRTVTYSAAPSVSRGWSFAGWSGCDRVVNDRCEIDVPGILNPAGRTDPKITAAFDDVAAPETKITGGPPRDTRATDADIAFAGDDQGIPGLTYSCEVDLKPAVACSSPLQLRNLADGPHRVVVWATDPSGNVDPTPAVHKWTVDTKPPQLRIVVAPAADSNSDRARFTLDGSQDISVIKCSVDGAGRSCWRTSPNDFGNLREGKHTFKATAYDRAGNPSAPATHTWNVDLTAPDTRIEGGPAEGSSTTATTARFPLASDPGASLECKLDGQAWQVCSGPAEAAYSGLARGRHVLEVRAMDAAGNVDPTPARRTWTVVAPGGQPRGGTPAGTPQADAPSAGQPVGGGALGTAQSQARVTYRAKAGKRFTRITKLAVDGLSAGAKVTVSCAGKGCTLRSKTLTASGPRLALTKLVRRAKLRPGTVVKVTVAGQQTTKLTVRRGKAPKVRSV
jgi:hypothetical protein